MCPFPCIEYIDRFLHNKPPCQYTIIATDEHEANLRKQIDERKAQGISSDYSALKYAGAGVAVPQDGGGVGDAAFGAGASVGLAVLFGLD